MEPKLLIELGFLAIPFIGILVSVGLSAKAAMSKKYTKAINRVTLAFVFYVIIVFLMICFTQT